MNSRNILLPVFLLFCVTALYAGGKKDKNDSNAESQAEVRIVQVTGVVRLVGSDPFTEIIIRGSDDQWYITGEEKKNIINLQHQTVTVEGEETVVELKFANGMPAGTRRVLRNIRIISAE